jgi:NAD(P)-dependent dehydrogenase (short-subunit alcohol dehydrogenase family)
VAVITGAGRGIGRAHALELARRGARLVVSDLDGPSAQAVADQIRAAGGEAIASTCAVANEDDVRALRERSLEAYGRVDIVVNNAGNLRDKPFVELDPDDYRAVLDVHVLGSAAVCRAFWPGMLERDYGRIVLTASVAGFYGTQGETNYCAAKMAVIGLMRGLMLERAGRDIRVNALAPVAATPMTEGFWSPAVTAAFRPEYVAPAVAVLAAEDAPDGFILGAGAGTFVELKIGESAGVFLGTEGLSAEAIRARWSDIRAGFEQPGYRSSGGHALKLVRHAGLDVDTL